MTGTCPGSRSKTSGDYWSRQVAFKSCVSSNVANIAAWFFSSGELDGQSRSWESKVTGLYQALFLRNPDPSGLAFWSWWFWASGGFTYSNLQTFMGSSTEFATRIVIGGPLSNDKPTCFEDA